MKSKNIDNLGLVAGMIDELNIIKIIDSHITQDFTQRKVSIGECVKAMILNGLGFVNSQLYLVSYFLDKKPIEKLFGREINPNFFNDDVLGRALDDLYSNDICQLFTKISSNAVKTLGLTNQTCHLDSTSFHTHGNHLNKNPEDENVIKLVQGYSRDHHPELNQAILEMIVTNSGGIPLAMKPLSGNKNDNKEFPKIIKTYIKNLTNIELEPVTFIADSALYSHENIESLPSNVKFITRVPERIKELKAHYEDLKIDELIKIDENYSYKEVLSSYGNKKQRWIILLSKPSQVKKLKTYEKNLEKKIFAEEKKIAELSRKEFACQEDAGKESKKVLSKLKYLISKEIKLIEIEKYSKKGRPKKDEIAVKYFRVNVDTERNTEYIDKEKSKLGLITLSTNHLVGYNVPEILKLYKDQGKVERGFRFLKDNTFMASSLFLEKPQRIEALMFIMCLCLMVYSAIEYRIRKELKDNNLTYTNQVGKEVKNPTARWIFSNFIGIHVVYLDESILILNKESKHRKIIRLLGNQYKKYYS